MHDDSVRASKRAIAVEAILHYADILGGGHERKGPEFYSGHE
jgi:hypothetical protein